MADISVFRQDYLAATSELIHTRDRHDPWGWAMLTWFEVCDELRRRDLPVPSTWEYEPGMDVNQDPDSYEAEILAECEDETLVTIGNVMQRYTAKLILHGMDY